MSGLRSATLQVIATVTVAAYLPFLGGLGRYIIDGAQQNIEIGYPAMMSAAILVALLAILIDGLLNIVQRLVVSPGVSGRFRTPPRRHHRTHRGGATDFCRGGRAGSPPIQSSSSITEGEP